MMMLSLVHYVIVNSAEIRMADRKRSVTGLPTEISQIISFRFDPFRTASLYFFNQVGNGDRSREIEEDVGVIFDSANYLCGGTPFIVEDLCHIWVEFFRDVFGNERMSIFGREDQMDVNV